MGRFGDVIGWLDVTWDIDTVLIKVRESVRGLTSDVACNESFVASTVYCCSTFGFSSINANPAAPHGPKSVALKLC